MRGRAWASLHWMVATCSITSAAVFTLWDDDSALSFCRRRAICFACLMKPSWSSLLEAVCDPELVLLALGLMNNRLTSSNSNSYRHSGHVASSRASSINFSTHDEQYVCPVNDSDIEHMTSIIRTPYVGTYHKEESGCVRM